MTDGRSLRAGKLQAGVTTSQGQQRESGSRRDDRRRAPGVPEAARAENRGTATKRNLSTAAGKAGGNPEAGRAGSAQVRHSSAGFIMHLPSISFVMPRESFLR